MNAVFLFLAAVLYLAATGLFLLYEHARNAGKRRSVAANAGTLLLIAGAILQFLMMTMWVRKGHTPFLDVRSSVNGLVFAWVVVGVSMAAILKVHLLGLVVGPIAAISLAVASILPAAEIGYRPEITNTLQKTGLIIHAMCGYAGYAAFFAASLGAALFLLQDRELRRKRLGFLFDHLPPLDRSVKIMRRSVIAGLALLAISVGLALLTLLNTVPLEILRKDPNINTVVALWVYAFATLLVSRRASWTSRSVVVMTFLIGVLVLIFRALFQFGVGVHSFSVV